MSLTKHSIVELANLLKNKQTKPSEIMADFINLNKTAQSSLNIYITTLFNQALQQAQQADERWSKGEQKSPYDGIPFATKDIFLTKGERTTNASKFLDNFIAPYESTVTFKLKQQGFINLGKLNMDEFAMGSSNITSAYGHVVNPWKLEDGVDRVPGGSSGGSAAAVAAFAAPMALGTDTGGSIRQPASLCGIVGLKPTYGTCSRFGIIAYASSLDQAGPLTRTVTDNAISLNVIAGFDDQDASMVKQNPIDYTALIGQDVKGLRVGIPKEYSSNKLDSHVNNYWQQTANMLKEMGAIIVDVSLPHTKYALPVYYVVASAEASSNLARFDGIRYGKRVEANSLEEVYKKSRTQGWGEEVKRRILIGSYNLLEENFKDYMQAAKVRALIAKDFVEAFKQVDVLLTPTTTGEAFGIGESTMDPIEMYLNDIFTVTVNLAGLPAISLPAGLGKKGLPIGMQLIGNYFNEQTLYKVAYKLEQAINFNAISSFAKQNNVF